MTQSICYDAIPQILYAMVRLILGVGRKQTMTRIKKLSQIETEIYNGMSFEMAEKVLFASRYMVYLSLGDNDNEINAIKDLIQNECKIKNIDYGNFNFENRSEVTDSILFKAIWDYSRSNPTILHDFGVIPFWVNAIKEMPIEK